jgi:hypothetical protein
VIKAQAAEKLLVAGVCIDHADLSAAQLAEVQRGAGEGAEKGAVHDGTALQIHDEVTLAPLDHRLETALHLHAILE